MAVYVYEEPLGDTGCVIGSRLAADSTEELLEFAAWLGFQRSWLHADEDPPHFSLTAGSRAAAIAAGASVRYVPTPPRPRHLVNVIHIR